MEFPGLGKHCSQSDCQQLDFLPMKCDACLKIFCNDHVQYTTHSCSESYKKDNQVPVCPLCNIPIPLKKGEVPDVVVGRHIDSDCQSDPAKERRKVYTNKCSFKGCKVKEMIPVKCDRCYKNFCLRHRFEDDHKCEVFENTGKGMSKEGAAAASRFQTKPTSKPQSSKQPTQPPQKTSLSQMGRDLNRERLQRQQQSQGRQLTQSGPQAGMSEDEAMARAIQMSLAQSNAATSESSRNSKPLSQEEEDQLLAQALAASEEEARREALRRRERQQQQQQQPQQNDKRSCEVS